MAQSLAVADLALPARTEAWKYTDLARLLPADASWQAAAGGSPANWRALSLFDTTETLVFVDGVWDESLSTSSLRPEPQPMAGSDDAGATLQQQAHQRHYRLRIGPSDPPSTHLLMLHSEDAARLFALDLDIQLAPQTQHQLLLEHAGGGGGSLSLLQLRLELATQSRLDLLRCQHLHSQERLISHQLSRITNDASLRQTHVEWGGAVSRSDTEVQLTDAGANLEMACLAGLNGRQHADHQVLVNHLAPHGRSRLQARGLVDDRARQIFNGKVRVARGAQQTDSEQLLRHLLLSDGAEVDAKPELEIFADDVRCAHGSTVGRLDPAALFYLRSRGLGESQARRLLMLSFAATILATIPDPVWRESVQTAFAHHLNLDDTSA